MNAPANAAPVQPCPFCAGPARVDLFDPIRDTILAAATPLDPERDYAAYAWCHECGAQGPRVERNDLLASEGLGVSLAQLRALAVERWNHRPPVPSAPSAPESVVDAPALPVTAAECLAAVSPFHPELPTVTREADHLVIRIGVNALCTAVTAADTWPMDGEGRVAQVTDQALFVRELASELLREDELGATPLHRAFDEAADYLLENGCAAIEDLDDQDE